MKKMPWFRMYTDFLNDPKLIALAFEDQRHFIGVLALKSDGLLDEDIDSDLMDRIVAQRLWIDHAIIRDVKKRLIAAGLIDCNWQPLAWERRQFKSDHDESGAERQRRHREKQKENSNALRNATVTPLDTDTDTDTEKKDKPNGLSKEKNTRATKLPKGFQVSDSVMAWYQAKGFTEPISIHYESFVEKCKAKGYVYLDWDAALRNAIADDWAKARIRGKDETHSTHETHAQRMSKHLAKLTAAQFGSDVGIGAI